MRIIKYIKENWFLWIIAILVVIAVDFNQEISSISNNYVVFHLISKIPFLLILLIIFYGVILGGIEENLWEEFKKGKDNHIDKMMRNLKFIILSIQISSTAWLLLLLNNLTKLAEIDYFKSILLISLPLLILVFISYHFHKLKKEYNS